MTPGSRKPQESDFEVQIGRMLAVCLPDLTIGQHQNLVERIEEIADNYHRPHPAASEREIRVDERREVLDEIIKLSTMLDKDETEKWESFGRPKNDGYINGSHSGYLHATRDIRSWIERIKWAERRQQSGGGK